MDHGLHESVFHHMVASVSGFLRLSFGAWCSGEGEYISESAYGRRLDVRVRWKGYGLADGAWKPSHHLQNAPVLVMEYLAF